VTATSDIEEGKARRKLEGESRFFIIIIIISSIIVRTLVNVITDYHD
jgi:hypothetical protein